MTTVVGAGIGNASIYSFFSGAGYQFNSPIFYTALTPTNFTLLREDAALLVNGVGFTYTDLGNGTSYAVGGTATGLGFARGASSQGWAGFNVSITDALTAVANHDELGFDNLFFGGDDTFNWTDVSGSGTAPILYGFGGNDVFNIGDMDANGGGRYHIDGGTGTDTLNLTGGVGAGYGPSVGDLGSGALSNFHVTNVETIKLGAGSNYTIFAPADIVTSGNALTVDGSALGSSNRLIFNTNVIGGSDTVTGNLVLKGGAGDDLFEGGTGFNVFNGGGGSNTVSFLWSQQSLNRTTGVTADLSNTGTQNFGPGWGTGTFTNIQNLVGTRWNDVLTGNAGNNILTVGSGISFSNYGNDVLNGGAGNDTAVVLGARSAYTITTAGGTTMLVSAQGTATLTGIEQVQFDDQTISVSGSGITVSHAPVITTGNASTTRNQTLQLSSLFNISNPSQEAITNYQLWDGTNDPNSGYFQINGVVQAAGALINITAAQLAQTVFVSGRVSDTLQIRALNAAGWSAGDNASWAPFTVSVPQDHAPSSTTQSVGRRTGTLIPLSDLVSVTDADGDTITAYQLWDATSNPASGHWVVNGVSQSAGSVINLTASDVYSTFFQVGSVADILQVRASDGILWSAADNASWSPFNVTVVPNQPPVVTTSNKSLHAGQAVSISSLAQVTDAEVDTITKYQLWVGTSDPNAGYFTVNGVRQPAKTPIEVTAGQLSNVSFVVGQAATEVEIRAFDGRDWSAGDSSAWSPFTVTAVPNHPPVVTTSNIVMSSGLAMQAQYLFTVTDADGDAMTKYQFWVDTSDPSAGYFLIGGMRQPAGAMIEVTAAQLNSNLVLFFSGSVPTKIEVRAFDGAAWSAADTSAWSPFYVSPTPLNNPPVVTTTNQNAAIGASVAMSSLFSVSDADGDTITKYRFVDSNSDPVSGHITLNGASQAAGTVVEITAAQLAQAAFVAGRVPDTVTISAFDGKDWSNVVASATITPPANHAPAVTTSNKTMAVGATAALSTLFSVSDADGDTMTKYQIWDATRDPNAGYVTINGQAQPAGLIEITAGQLAQTSFVMGSVPTNLQIRAFDGVGWSAGDNASWAPFVVSPPANNPPVMTTSNRTLGFGTTVALSTLFSVSDADGDTMTKYQLWDATRDPGAGYITINGVKQPAAALIEITASQLSQTSFVVGSVATSLQIRAFDGRDWSAADNANWAPFTVSPPPDNAPVVTTSNKTMAVGATVALSTLFNVSDADGDSMTRYQIWDGMRDPNAGYVTIAGVQQAAPGLIEITASQMAQASFVMGTAATNLQIRAFDGQKWSAADNASWAPFTVSPQPNTPPLVTTSNKTIPAGATVGLSGLFTVGDADGDTITKYQLWEATRDANAGYVMINGNRQPAGTLIEMTAAQMAQASFVLGTVATNLQIRAFDGKDWSAADSASWAPFNISPGTDHAPVLTTTDKTATAGQSFALSSLFSVSDADGDSMTKYQLWDSTADPSSGHFVVNSQTQSAGTLIEITAAQLSQTSFIAGASGHGDLLQIRAFDGFAWSAADSASWAPFHINV